jgi:hypothetical protein
VWCYLLGPVDLHAPVGSRTIVDATTGEPLKQVS